MKLKQNNGLNQRNLRSYLCVSNVSVNKQTATLLIVSRCSISSHCGVCTLVWLVGCIVGSLWPLMKFQKFIRFQKFQNQNVFQAILSNFDFWTPTPLSPYQIWLDTNADPKNVFFEKKISKKSHEFKNILTIIHFRRF